MGLKPYFGDIIDYNPKTYLRKKNQIRITLEYYLTNLGPMQKTPMEKCCLEKMQILKIILLKTLV